jgi:hypothetical protein
VVGILSELVPEKERGKYVMGTFLNLICLSDGADIDCGGVEEDWERLLIHRIGSNDNQHYATIHWKRKECKKIDPD